MERKDKGYLVFGNNINSLSPKSDEHQISPHYFRPCFIKTDWSLEIKT